MKDVRLSLPLTEAMKIVRLTSPHPDMPYLSSPRPRLRYGKATCTSLSPKSNPKSVYSLLRSVAGSSSSSSFSPNSPNSSSPRESTSVFPTTCNSSFRSPSQRLCVADPEDTFPNSAEPRAQGVSFVRLLSLFSRSISCGWLKLLFVHCPWPRQSCLSHAKASFSLWHGFLLHIFNLSWSLHSFSSLWKTSSIGPINKIRKLLDSLTSFRPIFLTSCVFKLFDHIILYRLLFFLESNFIFSPRQAGFHPERFTLDQILFACQFILDGFNKPRSGSWTILATLDLSKAFDFVWHPTLFHKLVSAGLLSCFAPSTQSFLLIDVLAWFFKITKVVPFESARIRSWPSIFLSFH